MFDVKPDKYEGKPLDRRLIVRKDNCKGIKSLYRLTFTHYLTSILLKFLSAKIDNREPAGFEVINFCGQKFQQNTREIMLLLSQIKYQQENNL